MANHKSAAKRAVQDKKKNERNSQTAKAVRTVERKLREAVGAKNYELAQTYLSDFSSRISKAANRGIIHARKAQRKIARLATFLSKSSAS